MIVSALVIIVVGIVLGIVLQKIMWSIFGNPNPLGGFDSLFK